ncbi:MAG: PA0069 family radical SAM protein [Candidatus Omnitrophica bacterium]|nr:PA0069 family radical SAM protein [Candidatus Omnitrophota bacterium]
MKKRPPDHGRGAPGNPENRFDTVTREPDPECDPGDQAMPKTTFLRDTTKSFITYNDSPDLGMSAGINPYRGCEHGCVYCFARPTHEYLGMSAGLDFESRIMVKHQAPAILRKELAAAKFRPQPLGLSGNTDPYQPAEQRFRLSRQCLAVLADFRNPVGIITKNRLVVRDLDILKELNAFRCVKVYLSITTLDPQLANLMEPRASTPADRLRAVHELSRAGIPVGVMLAPVIPGLTDEEIPAILEASAQAGAASARLIMVRLPYSVKDLFTAWLERHYPDRTSRILNRIKSVRNGRLNDPSFHSRLRGTGVHADQVHKIFTIYSKRYHLNRDSAPLTTAHFRKPSPQLMLFGDKL